MLPRGLVPWQDQDLAKVVSARIVDPVSLVARPSNIVEQTVDTATQPEFIDYGHFASAVSNRSGAGHSHDPYSNRLANPLFRAFYGTDAAIVIDYGRLGRESMAVRHTPQKGFFELKARGCHLGR